MLPIIPLLYLRKLKGMIKLYVHWDVPSPWFSTPGFLDAPATHTSTPFGPHSSLSSAPNHHTLCHPIHSKYPNKTNFILYSAIVLVNSVLKG